MTLKRFWEFFFFNFAFIEGFLEKKNHVNMIAFQSNNFDHYLF